MWLLIGQSIWFILPAGIANLAASLSRFIPLLGYSVDFGATWKGKRIFGDHKTWRGIIFGTIFGTLTFFLQQYLYRFDFFESLSRFDYPATTWILGLLLGAGAVWGDSFRSFFKRRMNRAPGTPWIPFDQIDYTIGAIAAASIVYFPGWGFVTFTVCFGFGLHILFNLLGYALKLQKNKL